MYILTLCHRYFLFTIGAHSTRNFIFIFASWPRRESQNSRYPIKKIGVALVVYAMFKNNSKSKFNDDHVYDVESIRFQICNDIKSFLRYITYPGIENKFEMKKIHNVLNIFN